MRAAGRVDVAIGILPAKHASCHIGGALGLGDGRHGVPARAGGITRIMTLLIGMGNPRPVVKYICQSPLCN